MINRINLILQAKNITAKQFAEEIGIQPSGMSHILSGRNNPSLEFVNKVIRRYPEIDANWLLLGKGQMYGQLGMRNEESGIRNQGFSSEPTLFSIPEDTPSPAPIANSIPEPDPIPEPMEEEREENRKAENLQDLQDFVSAEREQEKEQEKKEPAPISTDKRRLVKILFFYEDHSFEEYRPQ